MKIWKGILLFIITIVVVLSSCSKESIHGDGFTHTQGNKREPSEPAIQQEKRNVLILYSAGFNSISSYLQEDIEDIQKGWIPGSHRHANILLVYSHFPTKRFAYSTPTSPTLTRLYTDPSGKIIADTLKRYPAGTHSATPEQFHEVLSYIKDEFPAKSYGMIFSSHASGYLPAGYYTKPDDYIFKEKSGAAYRMGLPGQQSQPVPYYEPQHDPSLPAVKSIGQDVDGSSGTNLSYEIDLDDFAKALPMQMEYILFDACLMGGVEVAYELKDKCRHVGFSQTEVLAEGFNYKTLTTHLLGSDTPDPQAVCEDYFLQYDIMSGIYQSATISVVDCTKMEPLAEICTKLFEKYRANISMIPSSQVQRYFRGSDHWFYDLKDIIIKAGATTEEIQEVQEALDECIQYKAATPKFMESFAIKTYSGLSMYLPGQGSVDLERYYRTLEWNKATSFLK